MAKTSVLARLVTVLGFVNDPTGFVKFQAQARKAQATLKSVGRAATVGGAVLTGIGIAAVKTFASYEFELAKIEGLVGVNREVLQGWEGDIKRIATETAQSPQKLAEALFYITSAGLRGAEAIDVLRQSAKAAAAGLGEQATIADLLTSAMNAYGSDVLSATDATNALVEAVRLGKLEPASLANAMGRVLPVSSAMGVSFQEVAGLMAAMSKTGTTAEEATTQLTQVMLGMLKPSDGARKALDSIGMSAQELRDDIGERGLFWTLNKVRDAFKGNNQEMVKVWPNIRALRGIFDLLGPQLASNAALLDEMTDSTGLLDEAFDAASNTTQFRFKRAMTEFKIALMDVGQEIAPMFETLIRWMRGAVDWFRNLDDGTKKWVTRLLTLGPILLGIAVAAKTMAFAIKGLLAVTAIIKGLTVAVIALNAAFRAAAGGAGLLGASRVGLAAGSARIAAYGGAGAAGAGAAGARAGAAGARGVAVRGVASRTGAAALGGVAGVALAAPLLAAPADDALRSVSWYERNIAKPLDKVGEDYVAWDKWGGPALRAIGLAKGGLVKKPTLGLVGEAGPELVIPLSQLMRPLAAGPHPSLMQQGGRQGDTTIEVRIERIVIEVPSGDPEVIAAHLGEATEREIRGVAEQVDRRIRA